MQLLAFSGKDKNGKKYRLPLLSVSDYNEASSGATPEQWGRLLDQCVAKDPQQFIRHHLGQR